MTKKTLLWLYLLQFPSSLAWIITRRSTSPQLSRSNQSNSISLSRLSPPIAPAPDDENDVSIVINDSSLLPVTPTRRHFLSTLATTAATAVSASIAVPSQANANENDLINVYFGCGCFWHVHHEFIQAERTILSRPDDQLTSRSGYAGGTGGDNGSLNGKVCYHNAAGISDYGKLGHAEVVNMKIPPGSFEQFAAEYCKLFDKDGFRPDQFGDKGSEYRNLVGIPGGKDSPYADLLVKASVATGDKLDFAVGKGNDKDLAKVVFIMDSKKFPFFVAEQYHQFHDGFNWGEDYPNSYNGLGAKFAKNGEDFGSCPNGLVGIGIGGL